MGTETRSWPASRRRARRVGGCPTPRWSPQRSRRASPAARTCSSSTCASPTRWRPGPTPIGVNIPLGQLGDRLDEVPADRTIVVACHVGGRSATAAKALSDAGWTAENLTGGAVRVDGGRPVAIGDPASRFRLRRRRLQQVRCDGLSTTASPMWLAGHGGPLRPVLQGLGLLRTRHPWLRRNGSTRPRARPRSASTWRYMTESARLS